MRVHRLAWLVLAAAAFGCDDGASDPAPQPPVDQEPRPEPEAPGEPEAAEPEATPEPEAPPAIEAWRCEYTNPFSRGTDCKAYTGSGWTLERVEADCAAVFANAAGTLSTGACAFEQEIGRCAVGDPEGEGYVLVSEGADAGQCGLTQSACETFAQGTFTPGPLCDACTPGDPGDTGFNQPFQTCQPPLSGEAPGNGPNGEVCTWNHISGSTEEGRFYPDYGSCEAVLRGGRPYFAIPNPVEAAPDDPRLEDEAWLTESRWVTAQIEASACTCCHSSSATPGGYAIWDTEAGPLWFDQFSKPGLAMMAGLVNSDSFGAFEPSLNNGFDRLTTGAPTTDVARMKAFFEAEFARRGGTDEDLAGYSDFGGPLAAQLAYVPEACADGVGVMPDGTLMWGGGPARFVYVIEQGGANVGPPPNLDVPAETLWMLSVDPQSPAIACGGAYGEVPSGAIQRVPADGAPAPTLEPGKTYYFVVLRDIALPLERCLFTFEG